MELLFPLLPSYHSKNIISSMHVTDSTSSLESFCFIVCRSRTAAAATSWIMMVDRESEIVNVSVDPVSFWHLIVVVDHDRGGGSWSSTMITTRLLDIQHLSSDTRPLLTIIQQLIYFPSCYKLFILITVVNTCILLMFSITRGIYCTYVLPGRGIPHMWLSEV